MVSNSRILFYLAHTIYHDGHNFQVTFQANNSNNKNEPSMMNDSPILPGSEFSKPGVRTSNSSEPYICISISSPKYNNKKKTTINTKITVATISSFLEKITQDYMTYTDSLKKKTRSRYDYSVSGKWARICSLYEVQGLDTVALCPNNETLVSEDLKCFKSNKPFYKRIGFPYRYAMMVNRK